MKVLCNTPTAVDMTKICYCAPAQSEYLRSRSGRGPIVGVILSPKVLSRPGAQGIQLRVAPTMGLFLLLRRTPVDTKGLPRGAARNHTSHIGRSDPLPGNGYTDWLGKPQDTLCDLGIRRGGRHALPKGRRWPASPVKAFPSTCVEERVRGAIVLKKVMT